MSYFVKDNLPLLSLLLFVFVGLPFLKQLLGSVWTGKEEENLPYHSKYILTGPEYKFYLAIKPMMAAKAYIICPKVSMKDLFEVNAGIKDRMRYFGKIQSKHIDFLICDSDLRPLFAIELDDRSHKRRDVMERDHFKDRVYKSSGFPLYRVPTAASYSQEYLNEYLKFDESVQT